MASGGKKLTGKERADLQRKQIVDKVIEDMDKGGFEWVKPWHDMAAPHNPVTGVTYRGGNRTHLLGMAMIHGYTDPRWVTFKNLEAAGWRLREGERSCVIEHWKMKRIKTDRDAPDNDPDAYEVIPSFNRAYPVFNLSQMMTQEEIDEWAERTGGDASEYHPVPPLPENEKCTDNENLELIEDLIESSRCPIIEGGGNIAAYSPVLDRIQMPPRDSFDSYSSFTTTMLHEMGHSTGHPSALDRSQIGTFGSKEYAKEELVAELSSMFSASELGLPADIDPKSKHYKQHVAYLQNWREVISDDPDVLFRASSLATQATDMIVDRYEEATGREAPGRAYMKELDAQIPDEVAARFRGNGTKGKDDKDKAPALDNGQVELSSRSAELREAADKAHKDAQQAHEEHTVGNER